MQEERYDKEEYKTDQDFGFGDMINNEQIIAIFLMMASLDYYQKQLTKHFEI